MPNRSWVCLNRRCVQSFDSEALKPTCPRCGGRVCKWIPGGFAIMKTSPRVDATVKQTIATLGEKNYASPVRGERMMPRVNPIQTPGKTAPFNPMKGWGANIPIDQNGKPLAACLPTGVTAKLKGANIGEKRVTASKTLGAGSRIEGSWNPPGGLPK